LKWLARVATLTSFKPVRLSRAHNNSSRVDLWFLILEVSANWANIARESCIVGSETPQRAGLQLPGPIFYRPLMCVRKHLDSLVNPLTTSINVPFYFPDRSKLYKLKLHQLLWLTAMDDNKNIDVVTVDEAKDGRSEDGHGTQQISESNSNKNVLEVSSSSSCCNNCDRRVLFIYLHRPAIHQSGSDCKLRLYIASSLGSGGNILPVQFAQWRPSVVGLWQYSRGLRVDCNRNFTSRDGLTVSLSHLVQIHTSY